MYKKFLPFLVLALLTAGYLLLAVVPMAHAQQAFNVTASPNSFDVKVQPGSTTTEKIRLRNNTNSPMNLTISLKKLTPDVNGDITLSDFKPGETSKDWVSFPATLSALPLEWSDITLTLSVPKDAAFGYYYALSITPQNGPNQLIAHPQAQLNASLAIPLLVFVQKNGAKTDAQFLSFAANSGFFEYVPVTFTSIFQNKGNVHIKPVGNIFIKDWTGQTIDTIDVNKNLGSVLPGAKRAFTSVWDNSFITNDPKIEDGKVVTDSNGQPKTQLTFHFDRVLHLRIGPYTAHALLVVSGENRDIPYELSTTFWVIPWKMVLGLVIVILLTGIGLWNTLYTIWRHGRRLIGK